MADEMSTIPPRVNALERDVHTVMHRLSVIEADSKDIPHRMTKVELAVERLPQIEAKLSEQGDMIKRGFFMTNGILIGAAAVWAVFQAGPQILKFLGGN
jgi:hypothetical protein